MTLRFLGLCTLLFSILSMSIGCDSKPKESKRARVSGKVTLDNKPLKSGKIVFDAQNGEPPASMDILDGNYEGKAIIGKNKVMITAVEKISMKEKMKMDGPGYDSMIEINLLPPRFNTDSQISREVEAGDNTFNFDTSSK